MQAKEKNAKMQCITNKYMLWEEEVNKRGAELDSNLMAVETYKVYLYLCGLITSKLLVQVDYQ